MKKVEYEYWDKGLYIRQEEYYLSNKEADAREKELISKNEYEAVWNLPLCNPLSTFIKCLTKKKTSKVVCAR